MSNINMNVFFDNAVDRMKQVQETQLDTIVKASEIMAECIEKDGVIHVFGSGHSIGFGMELTGRPGSLVPIHFIDTTDFVTRGIATLEEFKDRTNIFERRPGVADKLYDLYDIRPQDVFIIISNSGINGVVIDLAIKAKSMNHKIIILTSYEHTHAEASRHPSGKKLYEFGDIVIDNCGPRGDALIETEGVEKVCSISSITGALIAQSMVENICGILEDHQKVAPILYSETWDGYKTHNKELLAKYKGRI